MKEIIFARNLNLYSVEKSQCSTLLKHEFKSFPITRQKFDFALSKKFLALLKRFIMIFEVACENLVVINLDNSLLKSAENAHHCWRWHIKLI